MDLWGATAANWKRNAEPRGCCYFGVKAGAALISRINERTNGNGVGQPDVLSIGPRRSGLEK